MKPAVCVIFVCLLAAAAVHSGNSKWTRVATFRGYPVEVFDPGTDEDGFEPLGSASICVLLTSTRQCYTPANKNGLAFGREPRAAVVNLGPDFDAILFRADSGGVSGWLRSLALVRINEAGGKTLKNLLPRQTVVSNQSEYDFWAEPGISSRKILVVADYQWGDGEGHYDAHRYKVSTYVYGNAGAFRLRDEYMTRKKYDLEMEHVLIKERDEILARLRQRR